MHMVKILPGYNLDAKFMKCCVLMRPYWIFVVKASWVHYLYLFFIVIFFYETPEIWGVKFLNTWCNDPLTFLSTLMKNVQFQWSMFCINITYVFYILNMSVTSLSSSVGQHFRKETVLQLIFHWGTCCLLEINAVIKIDLDLDLLSDHSLHREIQG